MDNELSGLSEEVRDAIEYCDDIFDDADNGEWAVIRAELLRLARKDATWLSRWNHAVNRYKRAEAERDALRKRIDDAPVGHPVSVDFSEMTLTVTIPNGFRTNGWPFALVPLDDAEAMG